MEISEFKRVLTAFADVPGDVDVRAGKIVAQIRDEVIDVGISYSTSIAGQLNVEEGGQSYEARSWLLSRVAKLPQLADRIIATTTPSQEMASNSPFVVPSGSLVPDLSVASETEGERAVPDVVEGLLDYATHPVPGATSVLYVTSDAGEGKTTVIGQAARLQAQRYKEKKTSVLVVPIPLSGKNFLSFDDAVIAALVNKLRFNYLYFDAFIHLIRMGAVIPAFDGYEEMLVEGSKGEAVSALGNLVQALDSSGTVFVAARRAFFEYLSFKTQARLLDAIGDRSASFSRLEISRWNRNQFCEYGRLRNYGQPEQVYETVAARLGFDHPLLTRAVLVRRLFDVASDCNSAVEIAGLLGANPHDYFFTFVDAIVKREARDKWLSRVSGEVNEPLLTVSEHHELLAAIAQEMWLSSVGSLRHDILDVIVDIFCETRRKTPVVNRQIKERIKQHSLLASDTSRGLAVAFDHDDFQNFYLGEALGGLLAARVKSDLHTFLSANLLSTVTVEQAIHYLRRVSAPIDSVLAVILAINASESGFSFCKENCGALSIRMAEQIPVRDDVVKLSAMVLPVDALSGRVLEGIKFDSCHFQPTSMQSSTFRQVEFASCEFERIEVDSGNRALEGTVFSDCRIDSLYLIVKDEYLFDPAQIHACLASLGGELQSLNFAEAGEITGKDDRFKVLERFLRVFLRATYVDEEVIRLRLGNAASPCFFDQILPQLLEANILEEVPWKGQGRQRRYKLTRQMSDVSDCLEEAGGAFERFLTCCRVSY